MSEEKLLMDSIRNLVGQLHNLWIEKEACAQLAISKGATEAEVESAKQDALNDPEIQVQTREQFSGMWEALEGGAKTLLFAEMLQSLPPTDKPN